MHKRGHAFKGHNKRDLNFKKLLLKNVIFFILSKLHSIHLANSNIKYISGKGL